MERDQERECVGSPVNTLVCATALGDLPQSMKVGTGLASSIVLAGSIKPPEQVLGVFFFFNCGIPSSVSGCLIEQGTCLYLHLYQGRRWWRARGPSKG